MVSIAVMLDSALKQYLVSISKVFREKMFHLCSSFPTKGNWGMEELYSRGRIVFTGA